MGKREKFPLPDINISDVNTQVDDLLFLAAVLRFGFGIDPERTTSKIAKRWTASVSYTHLTLPTILLV